MSAKVIVSNLAQFLQLISRHPALLQVPAFRPLEAVMRQVQQATASCGCSASTVYEQNKSIFTAALGNLQPADHLTVKTILGVREVCYFQVDSANQVRLYCH